MRLGFSETERRRALIEHGFVLRSTGGTVRGNSPGGYGGVSIDSRRTNPGDLFFAIRGENDGHDYVRAAFEAGAAAAVVENGSGEKLPDPARFGAALISVPSTVRALGDIALEWRRKFNGLTVVCITGSNGKTTTKQALAGILSFSGVAAVANKKSFNNHLGLPLTLLEVRDKHKVCIAEVGINTPGEMDGLVRIAAPDIGTITNIGAAHIGRFKTKERIAEEKARLFSLFKEENRLAVNLDDPLTRETAAALNCMKIGFGVNSPAADVSAFNIVCADRSTSFTVSIGGRDFPVTAPAVGRHNTMNFLCAASLALALGVPAREIAGGMEDFKPAEMRMEVMEVMGGVTLINDCYNANPDSVAAALEELSRMKTAGAGRGRAIAVLGDMLELDDLSGGYHREMGGKAVASGVDFLIAFGKRAEEMCDAVRGKVCVEKTVSHEEAADIISGVAKPGDVVLVKGSRGMEMEKITKKLRGL